jgi:hypothetical protein
VRFRAPLHSVKICSNSFVVSFQTIAVRLPFQNIKTVQTCEANISAAFDDRANRCCNPFLETLAITLCWITKYLNRTLISSEYSNKAVSVPRSIDFLGHTVTLNVNHKNGKMRNRRYDNSVMNKIIFLMMLGLLIVTIV